MLLANEPDAPEGVTLRSRAAYAAFLQDGRRSSAFARNAEPRSNPVGDKRSRLVHWICEETLIVGRTSPRHAMPNVFSVLRGVECCYAPGNVRTIGVGKLA